MTENLLPAAFKSCGCLVVPTRQLHLIDTDVGLVLFSPPLPSVVVFTENTQCCCNEDPPLHCLYLHTQHHNGVLTLLHSEMFSRTNIVHLEEE